MFLALVLLVFGVLHNNAFKWFGPELRPWVWNITGAVYPIALLVLLAVLARSRYVWLSCMVLIGFSLQVAGCTIWYLIDPWTIDPKQELCSQRLQAPLSMVGLWLASLVAQHIYSRGRHG